MSRQIDTKTTMQVRMDTHMVRNLKHEAIDLGTTVRKLVEESVVLRWGEKVRKESDSD